MGIVSALRWIGQRGLDVPRVSLLIAWGVLLLPRRRV